MPIKPRPEPPDFFTKVQELGERYLARIPNPTTWKNYEYWTRALDDLYQAYGGICAYSGIWISPGVGSRSVDHFKPKSRYPEQAYRWSNYRLVCSRVNSRKKDYEDVLDPFSISPGWFVINFITMYVAPGADLSPSEIDAVNATIDRLGLNDEGTFLQERWHWIREYCKDDGIPFIHLKKHAPFIAYELERQGLV